jgi:hypothetical protein
MSTQPTAEECWPVTVHTFGLNEQTRKDLMDRVSETVYPNITERLFVTGGGGTCHRRSADWADVREAARKAGLDIVLRFGRLKPGKIRHGMWTWRSHTPTGDVVATYRGRVMGTSIELIGVRGSMHLNDPTPAEVLTAARVVGLGGDSDADPS